MIVSNEARPTFRPYFKARRHKQHNAQHIRYSANANWEFTDWEFSKVSIDLFQIKCLLVEIQTQTVNGAKILNVEIFRWYQAPSETPQIHLNWANLFFGLYYGKFDFEHDGTTFRALGGPQSGEIEDLRCHFDRRFLNDKSRNLEMAGNLKSLNQCTVILLNRVSFNGKKLT